MKFVLALSIILATAAPTMASETFQRIQDKSTFLSAVKERELRLGLFGVSLRVLQNGTIQGKAMGKTVTGTWTWKNGTFCRAMTWGNDPIDHDCQTVAYKPSQIKFISRNGTTRDATFTLR